MTLDRSTPPQINDFGRLEIPSPRTITLPNGIVLHVINAGTVPVNNIFVTWNRGEADVDSPAALSLMVSCMTEGTSRLSGAEIADIFETNGSWIKFGTSLHQSYITAYSLNSNVREIIPVLIDIITNPTFDNDIFEIKKNKYITNKKIKLEKVIYQASLGIIDLNYGKKHPFAIEESPEEIAKINRDKVAELHRDIIATYPPVIYLSGLIDDPLLNLVIDSFSELQFKQPASPYKVIERQSAPAGSVVRKSMPGKKQSGIKMVIPTIPFDHPDFIPLQVVVTALGGYFGSRLITNIREDKGYTYGITARLLTLKEGSSVSITCECDNRYVDAVIEETKNELRRLADEPMDQSELQTVTSYLKSSLASCLDNAFSLKEYFQGQFSLGKDSSDYYVTQDILQKITPADIQNIARKYLNPDNLLISIAGDC
ncbi:MAG: insulinase family protein [Muribaculaceae bacterium]|nr:insulinase family protein [Muribaculaceae bacterium]MDE6643611.1 insulinase family protein [Muribaculaceae bacterium]